MKKTSLLFLFIAAHFIAFSQNYKTSIGIKIKPGIASIYNLEFKKQNSSRFGTSEGIEIRQQIIDEHLYLETGLSYSDKGFGMNIQAYDLQGNKIHLYHTKEIQNYLTLPLSLLYKSNHFYAGAGINGNYYLSRKYIVDGVLLSTSKSYQPENFLLGMQFFAGYETKIAGPLYLSVDGFTDLTLHARFINYGVGIGLKYVFNTTEK